MSFVSALTGNDFLLQFNTGTPGAPVWATIGSQRDAAISESRETIDVGSKDSLAAAHKPGEYSYEISLDHLYVPAAAEMVALRTAIRSGLLVQVREFRSGTPATVYSGTITGREETWPHNGEATVSCTFTGTGFPV